MGSAGTDVAMETADIALMADDLGKVAVAIGLSRRALGTIRQNIAFSLLTKGAFLLLTVPGLVTLWLAIIADTGASLLVTLNGMRLLRHRQRDEARDRVATLASRHAQPAPASPRRNAERSDGHEHDHEHAGHRH